MIAKIKLTLVLWLSMFCTYAKALKTEAFFELDDNSSQIMVFVYVKLPKDLYKCIRKEPIKCKGELLTDSFEKFRYYVDLNLTLLDGKGKKLKLIAIEKINGMNSENRYYLFCYEFGRVACVYNKFFFDFSVEHINQHSYNNGDAIINFSTDYENPMYSFGEPDNQVINYSLILCGLILLVVLTIVIKKLSKDII